MIHRLVWNFRHEHSAHWPTPSVKDALRFAYTEAGEMLDAQIRLNPTYKRNSFETPNPEKVLNELADVAIMLVTAVGQEYNVIAGVSAIDADLDVIARWVSKVWDTQSRPSGKDQWRSDACFLVNAISRYPDVNLIDRVQARLDRIKAKHVPAQDMIQDVGAEVALVG